MSDLIPIYDLDRLDAYCRRHGIHDHALKRFRIAFFKKGRPVDVCLSELPETARAELAAHVSFHELEVAERHDSRVDGATKLAFRTRDGRLVESVILRIGSGRTSLCISSQVGCAAGCLFCVTGRMGFGRNLTHIEMLDQVLLAKRLLAEEGRELRNVVVMGMGEPLRNEKVLYRTLEVLRDVRGCYLSEQRLLISTVGIPDAMVRFAAHFPDMRLALSLHSARQEVRERIMPVGRSNSLLKLREVLPGLAERGNLMIEYLLLKGVNDGPEDLAALIEYLRDLPVHINLIQYNASVGGPFEPVTRAAREAFGDALRAAGFNVTLRYSLGEDIAAACGQLAGKAEQRD